MTRNCSGRVLSAAAVSMLLAPLSLAGVVYEIDVTDHSVSPPTVETMEITVEGRNLKMESGGRDRQDMVFHGDRREMVVIDHGSSSYYVMDKEAMTDLSGRISSQLSQYDEMMREALKNVPADQREMVERMMKQNMPNAQIPAMQQGSRPERRLRAADERAKMNDYRVRRFDVLEDDRKIQELWVTDWDNVAGGDDMIELFAEMAEFLKEMMAAFGRGGDKGMDDNFFVHMKDLDGFPVVTRDFDDYGELRGESSLRSSRKEKIDPDAFEPPAGYRRQEMMGGP